MKALILENFNSPYQLKEIDKPVVGKGGVLVKIAASGVNPLDLKIKAGQAAHAKAKLPAILGIDLAGVVEEVGKGNNVAPEQMGATALKVGVTFGFTVIVNVVVVAHWPASGVNV